MASEEDPYLPIARDVLARVGHQTHDQLVLRMLCCALRMSEDARQADLKLSTAALEELERAFDVLAIFSNARKVALFGSARTPKGTPIYDQAKAFGRAIAERDYMVITGAGPGVMAAGNEGAGRDNSFGMNISLPFEQSSNEFIRGDYKLLEFKYFFTRKLAFLKDSHAVVLCPGGFGTLDEGCEALTLIQTGKAQLMPLVFLHPPGSGFWDGWDQFVRKTLLENGMISPADLSLYRLTDSVDEAVEEICKFYRRFHSMRYHEGFMMMRLTTPVETEELELLNQEFADILQEGQFEQVQGPSSPQFDRYLTALPHIRFKARWGRNGRLRQMIDWLNERASEGRTLPPERGEGGRLSVETDSTGFFPGSAIN
jgi:uncharacterized protein (TIGR00730 family)